MRLSDRKQFIKLPNNLKKTFTDLEAKQIDLEDVFRVFLNHIDTQKTIKSKSVLRSTLRGILRVHFNLTNEELKPIEASDQEKQDYHDSNKVSLEVQYMCNVSAKIITDMMKDPILSLLLYSGRRIGELLSNEYEIRDGDFYILLNKTNGGLNSDAIGFHKIFLLCPTEMFKERLIALRGSYIDRTEKYVVNLVNVAIKNILPNDFYKKSSHITRSIYARYIFQFMNPDKHPLPYIVTKYLNHGSNMASIFYQHITLDQDVEPLIFKTEDKVSTPSVKPKRIRQKKTCPECNTEVVNLPRHLKIHNK